jgi:hypothetical protein
MMKQILAASLASSLVLASPAVHAANVEIQASGPVVELNIEESVELEPDMATISAGVTTEAPSATEALRANSREMRRVIEEIKAQGVEEKDIQTSGISLNARYDYDRTNQRQVFRGYQVSNRVSVKLREIERVGEVLDALVEAGATDLSGPHFSVEDDAAALERARTRAMERGKQRAMAYANMAGFDDIKLLEINETLMGSGPVPMKRSLAEDAIQVSAAPVQPGMVSSGVSITVKYEMVSADPGHGS